MMGSLASESETLNLIFEEGSRPSLSAFQRMRRQLQLPHLTLGRTIVYDVQELRDHLETHHHSPKPE